MQFNESMQVEHGAVQFKQVSESRYWNESHMKHSRVKEFHVNPFLQVHVPLDTPFVKHPSHSLSTSRELQDLQIS